MLPAVLLNLCCLLFCWTYTACCSAELILPAVLLNLYCLLFCGTYAACCSVELILPAVLLNLYCLLFCWTYAACCSAQLMLPAVLLNLYCLLFCWTYTACCSAELMLPAVLFGQYISGLWIRIYFMWIRIQQFFWMRIRIQVQLNQIWRNKSWRVFLSWKKNIKGCSKVRSNKDCENLLLILKNLINLQLLAISLHFLNFSDFSW